MLKNYPILLASIILVLSSLPNIHSAQDVGTQTNWSFVDELRRYKENPLGENTLAQEITLAEFKEMLKRINEDLNERTDYLYEVLSEQESEKVIELLQKQKALIEEKISHLETNLPVHIKESPVNNYQRILTGATITVFSIAALFILYKASYDEKKGLQAPSFTRLKKNI